MAEQQSKIKVWIVDIGADDAVLLLSSGRIALAHREPEQITLDLYQSKIAGPAADFSSLLAQVGSGKVFFAPLSPDEDPANERVVKGAVDWLCPERGLADFEVERVEGGSYQTPFNDTLCGIIDEIIGQARVRPKKAAA